LGFFSFTVAGKNKTDLKITRKNKKIKIRDNLEGIYFFFLFFVFLVQGVWSILVSFFFKKYWKVLYFSFITKDFCISKR